MSSASFEKSWPYVKYSQPRPTGGAADPMVSNAPVDLSMRTASRSPFTRTRCCVMRDPASEARNFCSRTSMTYDVTRSIRFEASARSLSFDEVIVPTFTAGQQTTLPIWMLQELTRPRQRPVTNVVAVVIIGLTFVPILLAYALTRADEPAHR